MNELSNQVNQELYVALIAIDWANEEHQLCLLKSVIDRAKGASNDRLKRDHLVLKKPYAYGYGKSTQDGDTKYNKYAL